MPAEAYIHTQTSIDDPLLDSVSYADCNLLVHLRADALVYAVYSRVHNRFVALHEVPLLRQGAYNEAMDTISRLKVFEKLYRQVLVAVDERLFTLVPRVLFDASQADTYLHQFDPTADETTATDTIAAADVVNVYSIPAVVSSKLDKLFRNPTVLATASVMLQQCLREHKQRKDDLLWAHLAQGRLDIVALDKGRLVFYNNFNVRAPEDLAYYLLAATEQAGFNTDTATVHFIGTDDSYLPIARKYFQHVELGHRPAAFHYSQLMDSLPTAAYYPIFSLNACE